MAAGPDFASWLCQIDPLGRLDAYLPVLEEHFDLVAVESTYVTSCPTGQRLDDAFFADVGVMSPQHQKLFRDYFERGHCPATAPDPTPDAASGVMGLFSTLHQAAEQVSQDLAQAKAKAVPDGFAEWLRAIDPDGTLDVYLPVLEENLDFSEVGDRYVAQGSLTPQFFDDLGIEDQQHVALFKSGFRGSPSRAARPAVQKPDVTSLHAVARGDLDCSTCAPGLAAWLHNIDASGALLDCLPVLEEFSDAGEIRGLYRSSGAQAKEQRLEFFQSLGIADAKSLELLCNYNGSGPVGG